MNPYRCLAMILSLVFAVIGRPAAREVDFAPFRRSDGLWGFVTEQHCWAIRPRFEHASNFSEGVARVVLHGLVSYIDRTGQVVISTTSYDPRLRNPSSSMPANTREDIANAITEMRNRWELDRIHQDAWYFSEGLAAVLDGRLWGYIDRSGRMVIPAQFSEAAAFSDGLALVKIGARYGYIDRTGKIAINPQFNNASRFSERLAAIEFGGSWGFIDTSGRIAINPIYQFANSFSEGLAPAMIGNQAGYLDRTGRWAVQPQFLHAHRFSDGLAGVEVRERQWGYIDRTGRMAVSPQFERVSEFRMGLAAVGYSGQFIDKSGKIVIEVPSTIMSSSFSAGIGYVVPASNNPPMAIDRTGRVLLDPSCGAM